MLPSPSMKYSYCTSSAINLKHADARTHAIPATENDAPVDMALGIKLANGKPDLAEEMLDMLLASIQEDRPSMAKHCQEKQFEPLLEAVHKLHGATRYTGVPRLQKIARALEENLKLKQYEHTAALFQQLLDEMTRIETWQQQRAQQRAKP
jgi:two-component system sensor histidine kinase BarA